MSNKTWMKDIWADIQDQSIWNVILPGTHNSGVFSAWNTIGVRNQDKNIGEQLDGGIRVFDIRITRGHDTFVMHHSGSFPPDDSQNLEPAIKQIAEFVSKNTHEIVILKVTPGDGSNLEKKDYEDVRVMFLKHLQDRMVAWEDGSEYTLADIHAAGKNVIFISGIGKQKGAEYLFWDDSSSILKDTWEGYQSDLLPTPQAKIDWLKPHIEKALKDRPKRFLYASCMIWTINLHDAAMQWTNPKVSSWMCKWAANPETRAGMNIFVFDYFDVWDSQVVNTIIALNKTKATAEAT